MNTAKMMRAISHSSVMTAMIIASSGDAYAFVQTDPVQISTVETPPVGQQPTEPTTVQDDETVFIPPPISRQFEVESSDGDQDDTEPTDEEDIEVSSDEEIDAELEAELARIEELEKLSDPNELLKTFALKKPLIELSTPEPDRLMIANRIVARLFPAGTTERSLRTTMDELMIPMIDRALELTISEAVDLFGVPENLNPLDGNENADKKIYDLLAESDPKFREKMGIVFDAYAEITGLSSEPIEPALAGALARDYARKYDLEQLNDLDAFFSTPTGALFAKDFMLSTASIDMVQTALKEFPAIAKNADAIEAASKRIEEAFKPEPKEDEETETAVEDAEDSILTNGADNSSDDDNGSEPWFDNDNWDEATRTSVSQLEDTYNELAELSEQAYSQYDEAFDAAVSESRAKYIAEGWKRDEDEE